MRETVSKRELNRQKRCAAIVQIATRSFFENGYAATSMSAIADELGGSKATLWSHFSSKEALFSAVVDAMVQQFSGDIEEVLIGQTFSPPSLRRLCLRFLDRLMSDHAVRVFRLIISEGERFPEMSEVYWTRGPSKMVEHVTNFFATAFERDEAQSLAEITIAAVVGYRSQVLVSPNYRPQGDSERFVDEFIAHLKLPAERAPA